MYSNTAVVMFCSYVLFGCFTGTIAYFLTARIERIDSSTMKPLGLMACLALFATIKIGLERIGGGFWIAVGIGGGFWLVATALERYPKNVFDRITFFASALLMAAIISSLGLAILTEVCKITDSYTAPKKVYVAHVYITYLASTLASVFAAPLLKHLYQFAISMRPKPN